MSHYDLVFVCRNDTFVFLARRLDLDFVAACWRLKLQSFVTGYRLVFKAWLVPACFSGWKIYNFDCGQGF